MTAAICLILAIAVLLVSAICAFKRRYFWFIVLVIVADVIIVVPWSSTTGLFGASWGEMSIPQRVVYMIGLESWTDPEAGVAIADSLTAISPALAVLYHCVFAVLCIATPVVAGVAAYSIITQRFANWWVRTRIMIHCKVLRRAEPVYLFEGINVRTLTFVRSIYEPAGHYAKEAGLRKKPRCLCIVAGVSKDMREKNSTEIESIREHPILITEQSTYELCSKISKHLAEIPELSICFFSERMNSFGDPEGENVSDAVQMLELLAQNVPFEGKDASNRFTEAGMPRYHVNVACRGKSDELIFDSVRDRGGFDIHILDEGREVVYDLLWRYPLHETLAVPPRKLIELANGVCEKDDPASRAARLVVVVFGWGHYGFEAIRACAWSGQIPGARLHIHVVDKRPESDFTRYAKHYCPGFFQSVSDGSENRLAAARRIPAGELLQSSVATDDASLFDYTYHEADARTCDFDQAVRKIRESCIVNPSSESASDQLVPYCIVTLGDDDTNTNAAVDIKRLFCGDGDLPAVQPRIFVDIYDERRHDTLRKLMLPQKGSNRAPGQELAFEPFGGMARLFVEERIACSDVDRIALNANASYSEQFDPDGWLGDKVLMPSNRDDRIRNYLEYSWWQMFRLSNMANAMAVKQKLWMLGYEMDFSAGHDASIAQELQRHLDRDIGTYERPTAIGRRSILEIMARGEHDRWMAFYLAEGWMHESAATSKQFRDWGLNDRDKTRHDSHLLLRHPYICEFDDLPEVAEELEKDDPTFYDVRFIKDLVRIVTDARGFSGHAFGIKRQGA